MLALSAAAMLFGFGTNVLLGRAGPTTLGFYNFLIATYSLVTTFFVLGGNHVIVTYLPTCAPGLRARFLVTYSVIVSGFAGLLLAVSMGMPATLRLLYGDELAFSPLPYIALFVPIVLGQVVFWSMLQGTMRFRMLSVSQQLVSVLTFVFLAGVAIKSLFQGRGFTPSFRTIALAVAGANLAAILYPAARAMLDSRGRLAGWWRPYVPAGAISFALYFHASTLLYFVVRNADQFFVLRQLGLRELGFYRSAFVIAQLVAWFSATTDWIVYPTLCNLPVEAYPQAYTRFARLNALGTGVIAALVALFSEEALGFFGASASTESRPVLLILVGSMAVAAPLISLNNSVLMAQQKARVVLYGNLVAAIVCLAAYILLGSWLGLVGVGIAFLTLQVTLLVITCRLALRESEVVLPVVPLATSLVCVGWGLLGTWLAGPGWIGITCRGAMALLLVPLLVALRLVRWSELRELARLAAPRPRPVPSDGP
jgi:O-antigen/teichoic acid export membrane protein